MLVFLLFVAIKKLLLIVNVSFIFQNVRPISIIAKQKTNQPNKYYFRCFLIFITKRKKNKQNTKRIFLKDLFSTQNEIINKGKEANKRKIRKRKVSTAQ